jgi:hypothetical protein
MVPTRYYVDETALEQRAINGPAVVTAYYDAGYAWAEARGIVSAAECPADTRAYWDGCNAYFARRR